MSGRAKYPDLADTTPSLRADVEYGNEGYEKGRAQWRDPPRLFTPLRACTAD